jgi:hypothetical protein
MVPAYCSSCNRNANQQVAAVSASAFSAGLGLRPASSAATSQSSSRSAVFVFASYPPPHSISLSTAQLSMIRSIGVAFTMSRDTTFPPFAPMMSMIPRRAQGIVGEVSGLFRQFVKGSLQVVNFLSLVPCLLPIEALSFAVFRLKGMDEVRILPPRQVFRRDSTIPPD